MLPKLFGVSLLSNAISLRRKVYLQFIQIVILEKKKGVLSQKMKTKSKEPRGLCY